MFRPGPRVASRLFLLIGSTIVSLLAAEGLVRWLSPADLRHGTSWYEGNPVYQYRHRPHLDQDFWWAKTYHVRTNSRGLREDSDIPYEAGDAETALFFGDSFTFGNGVENRDCFVRRIEAGYRDLPGRPPARFINMGVSGHGPSLEYLYYREEGRRYRPRVVVIGLYTGNDIQDDLRAHAFENTPAGLVRVPYHVPFLKRLTRLPIYLWLSNNSHLLLKLRVTLDELTQDRTPHHPAGVAPVAAAEPPGFEALWPLTERVLTTFIREVREDGAEPVLVVFPPPDDVDHACLKPQWKEVRFSADSRLSEPARRNLILLGGREHVTVVDMLPVLAGARDEGIAVYLDADFHLNENGHALVAKTLLPLIADSLSRSSP